MAGGQKKVVVRRFGGELAWGYLPAADFARGAEAELMGIDGRVTTLLLNEIKTIAYVRDFNVDDPANPERMGRQSFLGRPRVGGLWLRLTFTDDDILEGMADFDLGALQGITQDGGLMVTPPDGRGNTLRVFIPRTALAGLEVLGWVQAGVKTTPKKAAKTTEGQGGLFE